VLVLALLLAASLLREAGAESFATSLPMSTRVKFQRDDCFSGGGRTFSERYTYNADGSVQSITATCRGGDENGRQCINTADTIN
jgi:hypothetical protein